MLVRKKVYGCIRTLGSKILKANLMASSSPSLSRSHLLMPVFEMAACSFLRAVIKIGKSGAKVGSFLNSI